MKSRVYLSSPHMSGNEMKYINEAFEQNWIAPIGPNVNEFEKELAEYTGAKYVAALSSGTAAVHLALINLGVQDNDEVLVSSLTFSASVNPIVYQKAIPIFIDSEPDTWNISPVLLRKAIKDRISKSKKPKAIIVVNLYGMPAKFDEIIDIAEEFQIPIIEDAAESLGSKYKNKYTGVLGTMGILSFNGNKIITTSGGGALLSDNEEFIKKARFLSTQARDSFPYYHHTHIGYNYRMSNVIAGIGRGQLEVIDERVRSRRDNFELYKTFFSKIEGVTLMPIEAEGCYSNRWLTCISIDIEKIGKTPEQLIEAFEKENIEARHIWKPMHIQPIFDKYPAYIDGTSENVFKNGLCLPSGSNLSDEDIGRIVNVLKGFFEIV